MALSSSHFSLSAESFASTLHLPPSSSPTADDPVEHSVGATSHPTADDGVDERMGAGCFTLPDDVFVMGHMQTLLPALLTATIRREGDGRLFVYGAPVRAHTFNGRDQQSEAGGECALQLQHVGFADHADDCSIALKLIAGTALTSTANPDVRRQFRFDQVPGTHYQRTQPFSETELESFVGTEHGPLRVQLVDVTALASGMQAPASGMPQAEVHVVLRTARGPIKIIQPFNPSSRKKEQKKKKLEAARQYAILLPRTEYEVTLLGGAGGRVMKVTILWAAPGDDDDRKRRLKRIKKLVLFHRRREDNVAEGQAVGGEDEEKVGGSLPSRLPAPTAWMGSYQRDEDRKAGDSHTFSEGGEQEMQDTGDTSHQRVDQPSNAPFSSPLPRSDSPIDLPHRKHDTRMKRSRVESKDNYDAHNSVVEPSGDHSQVQGESTLLMPSCGHGPVSRSAGSEMRVHSGGDAQLVVPDRALGVVSAPYDWQRRVVEMEARAKEAESRLAWLRMWLATMSTSKLGVEEEDRKGKGVAVRRDGKDERKSTDAVSCQQCSTRRDRDAAFLRLENERLETQTLDLRVRAEAVSRRERQLHSALSEQCMHAHRVRLEADSHRLTALQQQVTALEEALASAEAREAELQQRIQEQDELIRQLRHRELPPEYYEYGNSPRRRWDGGHFDPLLCGTYLSGEARPVLPMSLRVFGILIRGLGILIRGLMG